MNADQLNISIMNLTHTTPYLVRRNSTNIIVLLVVLLVGCVYSQVLDYDIILTDVSPKCKLDLVSTAINFISMTMTMMILVTML